MRPRLVSITSRCAVVAALALALALAGCGRKGALDAPPGGLTESSVVAQPTAVGPDGQPVAAAPAPASAPEDPRKRRLPLIDWLLD